MRESRVIEAYGDPRHAASYDKRPGTHRAEVRALDRLIGDLPSGLRLLDGPCGNVGDCSSLPLRSGSVDLAVCVRLIHHFPAPADRVAILGELARVARKTVVFSFYCSSTLQGLRRRLRGRSARVAVPSSIVLREAREAGLTPIRTLSLPPLVREQTFVLASVGS
jgi:SAM-dependent methyltransferase